MKRQIAAGLLLGAIGAAAPATFMAATPAARAPFQAGNTGAISGTVKDRSGKPLANQFVRVMDEPAGKPLAAAVTNANGEFRMDMVRAGRYVLQVLDSVEEGHAVVVAVICMGVSANAVAVGTIPTVDKSPQWTTCPFSVPKVQPTRWWEWYDRGIAAFTASRWMDAVLNLQGAVALEPLQAPNKPRDGAPSAEYLPYYYLGLAHLKLSHFDEAETNFNKAQATALGGMPPIRVREINEIKSGLSQIQSARRFQTAVAPAQAALNAKQFASALALFDALKADDPAEYAQRKLDVSRSFAAAGRAGELVEQGRALLQAGHLTEALDQFAAAERLSPLQAAADGTREIQRRRQDYAGHWQTAVTAAGQNKLLESLAAYQLARADDPEKFKADGGDAQMTRAQSLLATQQRDAATVAASQRTLDAARQKSRDALASGNGLVAQHRYAEALVQFQIAAETDKDNRDAKRALDQSREYERLKTEGQAAYRSGDLDAALQSLGGAHALDADRFLFDRLDATFAEITAKRQPARPAVPSPAQPAAQPAVSPATPSNSGRVAGLVHEAQLAYLSGDPAKVVSLLSPLATDNTLSATARADVHAYLAVAFAYQSVLAARDDERQRLTSVAQKEWRTALAANPKYRWPDNLVSPSVLKILGVVKSPSIEEPRHERSPFGNGGG